MPQLRRELSPGSSGPRAAGRLARFRLYLGFDSYRCFIMSTSLPADALGRAVLAAGRFEFRRYKTLADGALAQLSPDDWLRVPAPGANSVAVIVQHLVGNLRSRFTDFLTTDGEKPSRRRDQEFEAPPPAAAAVVALQQQWEAAWPILFDLLDRLQPADLLRPVFIRGEEHTVWAAVQRQVAHYAYHVGQIVQLARHWRGESWQSLSIARGQSQQFNALQFGEADPEPHSSV